MRVIRRICGGDLTLRTVKRAISYLNTIQIVCTGYYYQYPQIIQMDRPD